MSSEFTFVPTIVVHLLNAVIGAIRDLPVHCGPVLTQAQTAAIAELESAVKLVLDPALATQADTLPVYSLASRQRSGRKSDAATFIHILQVVKSELDAARSHGFRVRAGEEHKIRDHVDGAILLLTYPDTLVR